jgi:hypothetical protein
MDLYERQQFDFLLHVAVERFVERVEQLGEGNVRLADFTNAIFSEFLLDNADGACFVLRSLPTQASPALEAGTVEETLVAMAKAVFSHLLRRKVDQSLEQRSGY